MRRFGFVFIALTIGCGSVGSEELGTSVPGTQQQEIIDGWADSGHPSVGIVGNPATREMCTGTLIGNRTVLTAAHCMNASSQRLNFCLDGRPCIQGTATQHPAYPYIPGDNDIAVIRLDSDVRALFGIIPTRISTVTPYVNNHITLVGYGCTVWKDENTDGFKRYGYNSIDEVNSQVFQFDGSGGQSRICPGDSGGPVFHSYGDCQIGVNARRQDIIYGGDDVATRVDAFQAWILQQAGGDTTILGCNQARCGDGICHSQESFYGNCPADCPTAPCGDGVCNGNETPATCGDCYCGDGVCSSGESGSCLTDCCRSVGSSCSMGAECCSGVCYNGACGNEM